MKDKIRFEKFSTLSIASFSTAKDLAKMMKEVGIDTNQTGEEKDSNLKEESRTVSL